MNRTAVNGLGRIGRAVFKMLLDAPELEVVAVNDLLPLDNLMYLLKYDSVYGRFGGPLGDDEGMLVAGDASCRVLNEKDPAKLPWKELDVDIVFECTGIFREKSGMEKHIEAGARHVILSAPEKTGEVESVVYGTNTPVSAPQLVSCASCTTNCITPVAEIMARRMGANKAMMTTIHAYTSSQTIIDGPRKKWRRGRAGAVNFVPTTTGAAKATTRVLPRYENKFDGVAVRGPVPTGSLADMVFITEKGTDVNELNDIFREEAASSRYEGVVGVSEDPIVSSDIIQDPRASIVDLTMTQVVDGDMVKIMSWYDNEWGYASQMVRMAAHMARAAS